MSFAVTATPTANH